jgi:putative transposase
VTAGDTGGLSTSVPGDSLTRMVTKRKTVRRGHEPGDCHELTFSCYRGMPLLTNDVWRTMLAESVDRAMHRHEFSLVAFVFMPEHVHLLVFPQGAEPRLDLLLKAIKRPFSLRIKQTLIAAQSPLLKRLTIRERPGVDRFRFWQEGGGYDRNMWSEAVVLAAIDYIRMNPVRRGLSDHVVRWKWSSAGFYHDLDAVIDTRLPEITRLPAEFFELA